jgi:hypothetical protein
MRFVGHAAAAALLLAFFVGLSAPAQAGRCCADRYVQNSKTIRHYVFNARYRHVSRVDPYAYTYKKRGYYPHYKSGYWRPLREVRRTHRRRFRSQKGYRYRPSWGNPWGRHRHPRKSFWFWHY